MRALAALTLLVLTACPAPSPPVPAPSPKAPSPSTPGPQPVPKVDTPAASGSAPTASAAPPASSAAPSTDADALVGQPAPDFTATAQDGSSVHIAALKGKPVVVYFYPKDETPGCTKEACSFRDAWKDLAKTGAVLVGVSADGVDSHKAFTQHWKLPFLLVSDPDGAIAKKYGVPFEGMHKRQTVVIGADGNVRKVYRKVDVTVHAQQVLADVAPAT
ncbi:MAG TPA: peroxiredoxin [Polyangiaceae bacterium]